MVIIVSIVFIFAYVLISAEHKLQINKSAVAMFFAGILWAMIAYDNKAKVTMHLSEAGAEIFEIIVFLLCAMTLVEILVHYRYFDVLRSWLISKKLGTSGQLWVISLLAFLLSSVIDNLTTSIILTQFSRMFYKGKALIITAGIIVVSANAGGAFSPIGDITTTMLWLQGKFEAMDIIMLGFLPSLAVYLVSVSILIFQARRLENHIPEIENVALKRSEKLVIAFAFGSFALPFIFNEFGLRPYMGLLTGLGLTWLVTDLLKRQLPDRQSHMTVSMENLLQKTDISSLNFFVGILLAIAALGHLGILEILSTSLFGHEPAMPRLILGSSAMGLMSAIVDNVPLTAAAIDIVKTSDPAIWVLIALSLGTGGSILVIGSAAGVVAMGSIKELNFINYFKTAGLAALAGYACGIATWYLQYLLIS